MRPAALCHRQGASPLVESMIGMLYKKHRPHLQVVWRKLSKVKPRRYRVSYIMRDHWAPLAITKSLRSASCVAALSVQRTRREQPFLVLCGPCCLPALT